MKERHFNFFISKLRTSVAEHLDNVQLFSELQEECLHIINDLWQKNNINRDTLRSLMHFNIEVKQIIELKLSKSVYDHHSVAALNFINRVIECEITIIKDTIISSPTRNQCSILHREECDALQQKNFYWTGDDIEIVEVIESLLLLDSINNGNVTKKEFYAHVEKMLNVDLSHHNKILCDIKARKDDFSQTDRRIRYIPKMQQALADKLQRLDTKIKT